MVKKPTITETITLNRLCWFGHEQRMEENRIPKSVLYMYLGKTRLRSRPRNRWQDGVGEDGRIVGGEGWQEKVHNREEWKKLLRTARDRQILHMPMEWMNGNLAPGMCLAFLIAMWYLPHSAAPAPWCQAPKGCLLPVPWYTYSAAVQIPATCRMWHPAAAIKQSSTMQVTLVYHSIRF